MTVRRSLPQRARSLIGARRFVDHYGPDDVSLTGGMAVPGHPRTCRPADRLLAVHRRGRAPRHYRHPRAGPPRAAVEPHDRLLRHRPLGVLHAGDDCTSRSAQLWIALPEADRFAAPGFAHYEPPVTDVDGARVLVFLGSLFGQTSPVPMYSALVGAEVTLAGGHSLDVKLDAGHEHGFLCDTGSLAVGGAVAQPGEIVFQPAGASAITLEAGPSEPTRVLVLGGKPFGEQIVMWWNFIGRSHEEVAAFREEWQRQRADQTPGAPGRYGAFPDVWETRFPHPNCPTSACVPAAEAPPPVRACRRAGRKPQTTRQRLTSRCTSRRNWLLSGCSRVALLVPSSGGEPWPSETAARPRSSAATRPRRPETPAGTERHRPRLAGPAAAGDQAANDRVGQRPSCSILSLNSVLAIAALCGWPFRKAWANFFAWS